MQRCLIFGNNKDSDIIDKITKTLYKLNFITDFYKYPDFDKNLGIIFNILDTIIYNKDYEYLFCIVVFDNNFYKMINYLMISNLKIHYYILINYNFTMGNILQDNFNLAKSFVSLRYYDVILMNDFLNTKIDLWHMTIKEYVDEMCDNHVKFIDNIYKYIKTLKPKKMKEAFLTYYKAKKWVPNLLYHPIKKLFQNYNNFIEINNKSNDLDLSGNLLSNKNIYLSILKSILHISSLLNNEPILIYDGACGTLYLMTKVLKYLHKYNINFIYIGNDINLDYHMKNSIQIKTKKIINKLIKDGTKIYLSEGDMEKIINNFKSYPEYGIKKLTKKKLNNIKNMNVIFITHEILQHLPYLKVDNILKKFLNTSIFKKNKYYITTDYNIYNNTNFYKITRDIIASGTHLFNVHERISNCKIIIKYINFIDKYNKYYCLNYNNLNDCGNFIHYTTTYLL